MTLLDGSLHDAFFQIWHRDGRQGSGPLGEAIHHLHSVLMWQLAVIIGMIGAIRVYLKWHYGYPVIGLIKGWVGACICIIILNKIIGFIVNWSLA